MFPLTPDQHHWLEVATEDEGWCSFTSCTPSRSRARMDGWVGHVGWPIADVWPTKWSSVWLLVWRRNDRESLLAETSVLPTATPPTLQKACISLTYLISISILISRYFVNIVSISYQNWKSDIEASLVLGASDHKRTRLRLKSVGDSDDDGSHVSPFESGLQPYRLYMKRNIIWLLYFCDFSRQIFCITDYCLAKCLVHS